MPTRQRAQLTRFPPSPTSVRVHYTEKQMNPSMEQGEEETSYSLDMEKFEPKRALTRIPCFDKRTHKIFSSSHDKLPLLLPRFKMRGVGIVEPQHLSEDRIALMNDRTIGDFEVILPLIQEVVVLPFGVAFALNPGEEDWEYILVIDDSLDVKTVTRSDYNPGEEDWEYIPVIDDSLDVKTVTRSDYAVYRQVSMTGSGGEVLQNEKESPGEVLQHKKGSSARKHWKGKKEPAVIKKKQKQ